MVTYALEIPRTFNPFQPDVVYAHWRRRSAFASHAKCQPSAHANYTPLSFGKPQGSRSKPKTTIVEHTLTLNLNRVTRRSLKPRLSFYRLNSQPRSRGSGALQCLSGGASGSSSSDWLVLFLFVRASDYVLLRRVARTLLACVLFIRVASIRPPRRGSALTCRSKSMWSTHRPLPCPLKHTTHFSTSPPCPINGWTTVARETSYPSAICSTCIQHLVSIHV